MLLFWGTKQSSTVSSSLRSSDGTAKKLSVRAQRAQESIDTLETLLKPGTIVYTSLRHVSASGMTRWIDVFVADGGTVRNITGHVCDAADMTYCTRRHSLKIGGGGMDMGFQVVYLLGLSLWPAGTPEPHGRRNGEPDSNGGYALRHQWL